MTPEIRMEQTLAIKNTMIEQKNDQIVKLEMEIDRLRSELRCIAKAQRNSFTDDREFRLWAQNRAWHALGEKPEDLTFKKETA